MIAERCHRHRGNFSFFRDFVSDWTSKFDSCFHFLSATNVDKCNKQRVIQPALDSIIQWLRNGKRCRFATKDTVSCLRCFPYDFSGATISIKLLPMRFPRFFVVLNIKLNTQPSFITFPRLPLKNKQKIPPNQTNLRPLVDFVCKHKISLIELKAKTRRELSESANERAFNTPADKSDVERM